MSRNSKQSGRRHGGIERRIGAGLLLAVLLAGPAHGMEYESFDGPDLALTAGTLGPGFDVSFPLLSGPDASPGVKMRVGMNGFAYTLNTTLNDVEYEFDLRLFNAHILFDWHPFHNGFRMTAGALYYGNQLDIKAVPRNNVFTFNNISFGTNVGTVDGEITTNTFAPYLGIGFDRALGTSGRWGMNLDAGLVFHGTPIAALTARCDAGTDPATCAVFRSEVENEEDSLNRQIRAYQWYPVLSFAGVYRF